MCNICNSYTYLRYTTNTRSFVEFYTVCKNVGKPLLNTLLEIIKQLKSSKMVVDRFVLLLRGKFIAVFNRISNIQSDDSKFTRFQWNIINTFFLKKIEFV